METIDYSNTGFTFNKMIPEVGNELTALWGYKLIENYANAFGVIGTATVDGLGTYTINLGLTRKFYLPPQVSLYINTVDQGIIMNRISHIVYSKLTDTQKWTKVFGVIAGDILILVNGGVNPQTIYYRIHGV